MSSGHKTALARVPFTKFSVELSDGTRVEAFREEPKDGDYTLRLFRGGNLVESVEVDVEEGRKRVPTGDGRIYPFLRILEDLGLDLILLPDDRRVRGLDLGLSLRQAVFSDKDYDSAYLRHLWSRDPELRHTGLHLDPRMLARAVVGHFDQWIRRQALQGSSAGQESSDALYVDVIHRIATARGESDAPEKDEWDGLRVQAHRLGAQSASYTEYGLLPRLDYQRLAGILDSAPSTTHSPIYAILRPYLDGYEARMSGLEDPHGVIKRLLESFALFFEPKRVVFDVSNGLSVRLEDGTHISPASLSSGERQMLILLCTAATAPSGSIFIVDEPELSLNIKWQRRLPEALLSCTEHSGVQFILATHSLEILSSHEECVRQLELTN